MNAAHKTIQRVMRKLPQVFHARKRKSYKMEEIVPGLQEEEKNMSEEDDDFETEEYDDESE